jgi:hypothetical protein
LQATAKFHDQTTTKQAGCKAQKQAEAHVEQAASADLEETPLLHQPLLLEGKRSRKPNPKYQT